MTDEPDGFAGIFGSSRGLGGASLAEAEPSTGARLRLERLLEGVSRGSLAEALEELSSHSGAAGETPLLDALHRAVAEALLDEALAARESSTSCIFDVTGLPASLLGTTPTREHLVAFAEALLGLEPPQIPDEARAQVAEGLGRAIVNALALAVMTMQPSDEPLRALGIPDKGAGAPLGIIPLATWRDLLCDYLPAGTAPGHEIDVDMMRRAFKGNVARVVRELFAGEPLSFQGRYERRYEG
jgi:hypothetical protein